MSAWEGTRASAGVVGREPLHVTKRGSAVLGRGRNQCTLVAF